MRIAVADMDQRKQINTGAVIFEASGQALDELYKLDPELKESATFQALLVTQQYNHIAIVNYYDLKGDLRRRMTAQVHDDIKLTLRMIADSLGIKVERMLDDVSKQKH